MAKQRNSLGIVVLKSFGSTDPISWDEYKKRYGIDLDSIFTYATDDESCAFRGDFTKLLAIDLSGIIYHLYGKFRHYPVPIVSFAFSTGSTGDAHETMVITDSNGSYSFNIDTLNKTIQVVEV